jgi:hypothetical protein
VRGRSKVLPPIRCCGRRRFTGGVVLDIEFEVYGELEAALNEARSRLLFPTIANIGFDDRQLDREAHAALWSFLSGTFTE